MQTILNKEMSLWQCMLLLNFCLIFHCELIKRLTLCYHQEMNKNMIDVTKKQMTVAATIIYLFLEMLLNQIKPIILGHQNKHKIERQYSGEKLHSCQSLLY